MSSLILQYPSHPVVVPPSTGFPTPAVTDNFNRANGALGASWGRWWNGDFDLNILSNQARTSTADFSDQYYNAIQSQECDVAITISTLPGTGSIVYLGGRVQSPGTAGMDCYQLTYTNAATDTITISRVINEAQTDLQTWNQNLSAGDGIGMRISGTGATVTIDIYIYTGGTWSLFQTYADSNANRITATGYGAIGTNSTTTRLDDFIIGNS